MEFDGIFDGLKENKKTLIVVLVLTIAMIAFSILNLVLDNNDDSINMKGVLNSFAEIYYEEYYYPELKSNYKDSYYDQLEKIKKTGIKLTLREMIDIFSEVDTTKFYEEGNYCDFLSTYAIIYPKAPYDIEDYKVKINISCEKEIFAD